MVTGFPPYDMPSREDERFQIIYNGDLMKQLEAWESECLLFFTCVGCANVIMLVLSLLDKYDLD